MEVAICGKSRIERKPKKDKPKTETTMKSAVPEIDTKREIYKYLTGFRKYYFKSIRAILATLESKFPRDQVIDALGLTQYDLANPSILENGTSIRINKLVGKSITYPGRD